MPKKLVDDNAGNDDLFDDLLMDDPDGTTDDDILDPKEMKVLKDEINELKREKKGILAAKQEEKRKRQNLEGRVDQITDTINDMLTRRDQLLLEPQSAHDKKELEKIKFKYDDEGDPYLEPSQLDFITNKYEEKISALEEELAQSQLLQTSNQQYNQLVDSIVGKKPEYQNTYRKYRAARKWVDDKLSEYLLDVGRSKPLTSGEALGQAIDQNFKTEFDAEFPGLDMLTIVTAEDSPWHFEQMLTVNTERLNELQPAPSDSRFRRVMNKPSTLGGSANAKGGELSPLERIGSLSAEDLMNMTDEQASALERQIRDEEQKDGIVW